MAEKKYSGAPFGVQSARFDVSAVYPDCKMPGGFVQAPYCRKLNSFHCVKMGPGKYDLQDGAFSATSVADRAAGPGWSRAYEVARVAALPHLLFKEQWEAQRLLKRKMGPGIYESKDFLQHADEKPRSTNGIIYTRQARFKEKYINETPGPGTYGKRGIPQAILEENEKKSASQVGLLDSGKNRSRSLPLVGSDLAPGLYKHTSFTDDMEKNVTSLRGPYDVFSLDRNKPIRTGHYAAPMASHMGPGQYELKSSFDEFNTEKKKHYGKFGKMAQYPEHPTDRLHSVTLAQNPRSASEPGPGSYETKNVMMPKSQATKSPPFLCSANRSDKMATKFFTGNFSSVGPGRYEVLAYDHAQHKNGHRSVFKSKTQVPTLSRDRFMGELIRSKDDRVYGRKIQYPLKGLCSAGKQANPHQSSAPCVQRAVTVI